MEDIIVKIILSIGIAVVSWLAERVISLLNSKIKNEKARKYLTDISIIVSDSVKSTYQEYVETLKNSGTFTEEAQKKALEMSKEKIKSELTDSMKDYIVKNKSDFETWLETAIHSELYNLKNK